MYDWLRHTYITYPGSHGIADDWLRHTYITYPGNHGITDDWLRHTNITYPGSHGITDDWLKHIHYLLPGQPRWVVFLHWTLLNIFHHTYFHTSNGHMTWIIKKVSRIPTHCGVACESICSLARGHVIRVW